MAKNLIGTVYDDNGVPLASSSTGDGGATGYANLNVGLQTWNGTVYERAQSRQGAQLVTSAGTSTVAIASGTASNTVVKASAGRIARISVTSAAGTTTGTTPIYDNATTNSGTILAVLQNNTAVGTIVDVQMPAANGITVGGVANSPGLTVSYA